MGTVMSTATVPQCAPGFHTMGGDEAMRQYDICRGETLECMNNILNRMGQWGTRGKVFRMIFKENSTRFMLPVRAGDRSAGLPARTRSTRCSSRRPPTQTGRRSSTSRSSASSPRDSSTNAKATSGLLWRPSIPLCVESSSLWRTSGIECRGHRLQ